MDVKGQTVVELLLLLAVSMIALSIIYSIYINQINSSNIFKETSVAKSTINKIVNSANSLALSGAGSTQKILIEIPSGVNLLDSNISGKLISITLSNGNSIFGLANVNLEGEFKKEGGVFVVNGYYVTLTFDGEKVILSYDDYELNTTGIFVSAKQGTQVQKQFTIRNNSPREATFWLKKDFSFSSVAELNINSDDLYFILSPNEVRVIDFNVVLSDFSSGNYAGKINIIGQINDGLSDNNITKGVVVSVESILEFEPVMILPKSTSFSALSKTSTIKSFSLCNSTENDISSITWQRNSNPDANMLEWFSWPIVDSEGVLINSVAGGECAYFDLNFTVPFFTVTNTYDANITVNYGNGNSVSAYFFIDVSHIAQPYSLFFSTSNSTLSANYFLSNFVTQKTDTNYFSATGELDWNSSNTGSELKSSNYLYDSDLIALWHFNDKNSDGWVLNSVSGVRDVSLDNSADINGSGLWNTKGVFLNGFDGGLTLPNISLSSTFSYSAWIYPIHSTGMTWNSLFANDCDNGIYYMEDSQKISFYYSGIDHLSDTPLVESRWHHIVVTNNAGSVTFYVDGVADGSASSAPGFIVNKIGNDYCGEAFNGYIEEVAVWDRVLNENEIDALYMSQTLGFDLNLVAYYKFNSKNGTTVYDSARGNNGNLVNSADIVSNGLWDSSNLSLNGSSYVSLSSLPIVGTGNFTLSAWVKSNVLGARQQILSLGSLNANQGIWFYIGTDNKLHFDCSNNFGPSSSVTVANGIWHNVVVTNTGGTIQTYVDGVASGGSQVMSPNVSAGSQVIGRSLTDYSSPWYFKGYIDEVKIYDRALSEPEVLSDYNSFLNAKFVDANIIDASSNADWNFITVNSDVNFSFGHEIDVNEKFSDGLVGLWHLNDKNSDDWVLNSVSGVRDANLNGSADVNAVGLWDTNSGSFNGSTSFITTYTPITNQVVNVTLSAWFRTNNPAQAGQGVVYNGSDNIGNGYGWFINKEGVTTGNIYLLYGGVIWYNTGIKISDTNWHHGVMVILASGGNEFYLDGVKVYTGAVNTRNTPTLHTEIGRNDYTINHSGTPRYFNGSIEEVAIWNRQLSSLEIMDLYRKGVSRLDLNVYSCSDSLCVNKTGSQSISNIKNSVPVNLNSSVLNSRYLGFDAYFKKANGFEDYNAEMFWVGSYLKDFNVVFYS